MKKNIIAVLVCGLLCTQAMVAFADTTAVGATEELPMVIAAAPASYSISLNGSTLDLTGKTVYTKDGKVMIPLRAVAEKLGFTVTWDGEHKGVKLDNGEVNTIVYEGVDSYYMASSTAIGMSAPTELGAAPEIKEDTTYVPAELFAILYCNPDAVKIENGNIIIRSDVDEPEVGIPNPIKDYDTADAEDAVQDVFIKLLEKNVHFESAEHEKAWFTRVTINVCKNKLRMFWNRNTCSLHDIGELPYQDQYGGDNTVLSAVLSLPEKPSRADSPRENIPPRTTAPTSRPVEEPTFTQVPVQTVMPIPDDTPPEQSGGMMGGSPFLDFDSVAELEQTTGFAIPQLSLPTGYELSSITLVGGTIAQLRYTDSAAEVIYRMEKGTDDCSGDYNSYETTEQIPGKNGELKGTGGLYFTAVWSDGEYAYAVSVPEGTTREALIQMIDAV